MRTQRGVLGERARIIADLLGAGGLELFMLGGAADPDGFGVYGDDFVLRTSNIRIDALPLFLRSFGPRGTVDRLSEAAAMLRLGAHADFVCIWAQAEQGCPDCGQHEGLLPFGLSMDLTQIDALCTIVHAIEDAALAIEPRGLSSPALYQVDVEAVLGSLIATTVSSGA